MEQSEGMLPTGTEAVETATQTGRQAGNQSGNQSGKAHEADGLDLVESRRRLGLRLRLARHAKGLTLKALAQQCGCSESLLSKVENGRALPSLPLVHRLVRVLETNISWLFEERDPEDSPVSRKGKRPIVTLDHRLGDGAGVTFERIIPFHGGHLLQSNIHHIDVSGSSGAPISHEGEETGYVLRGAIELVLDGTAWRLEEGDSFCFPSDVPHSYRNVGKERASILWTCTPPTF